MATVASPYGLRPVRFLNGAPYAGQTRLIPITSAYGTNIFFGDVVKMVATGTVEKDTGTTTLTPVGVFCGCAYAQSTGLKYFLTSQMWPASTAASFQNAYVADAPDLIFQIQADEAMAATDIGLNAAVVNTAGSTATGLSAVVLDASTKQTTNTLPLRILGFVGDPTEAFPDVLVKWNAGHQYTGTTGL